MDLPRLTLWAPQLETLRSPYRLTITSIPRHAGGFHLSGRAEDLFTEELMGFTGVTVLDPTEYLSHLYGWAVQQEEYHHSRSNGCKSIG